MQTEREPESRAIAPTGRADKLPATPMDAALSRYISSVRDICGQHLSLPTRVDRIREAAGRLVSDGIRLSEQERYFPPTGYGRNLLWRDPDHGFVVIAMVWPANTIGSPHDHMTWGVVAVAEGELDIVNYRRDDDGSVSGKAVLHERERFTGKTGGIGYVLPPHEDIHEISNRGTRQAISIHTYGRDIRRCHAFDLKTGDVKFVDLAYHNESGA